VSFGQTRKIARDRRFVEHRRGHLVGQREHPDGLAEAEQRVTASVAMSSRPSAHCSLTCHPGQSTEGARAGTRRARVKSWRMGPDCAFGASRMSAGWETEARLFHHTSFAG
jgi:hypothetical protein